MESILQQLSSQTATLARDASQRLFHVPSPAGGRTALSFDGKRLLVPAIEAEKNEELAILAPGGKPVQAKVIGFDRAAGFAVLELTEALPATAWTAETGMPALGSLLLSLSYPSDEGPEARLDLVRMAQGEPGGEDSYIQTDGSAFPGFSGGALVGSSGSLAGVIAADRPGNHGWALPALRARSLVDAIVQRGFPGSAWLGVSTLPVDLPEAWKALVGGRAEAPMIAAVEAGSPAASAGLLPGDIIVSLGGRELGSPEELREGLGILEAGKGIKIVVLRGGTTKEVEATLGEHSHETQGGHDHHKGHGHHHNGAQGHHHHGDHGAEGGCGCGGNHGSEGGDHGSGGGGCGCGKGH